MQIFRAGTHIDSRGQTLTITAADLAATAAAYDPALHEAPLVIGHPALDDPAYGWVESLSATGDGALEAAPRQVDLAFAELVAAGRYKKISASFYRPDAVTNPAPGAFYLRHVGFLGAQPPAVKGLRAVQFASAAADDGLVTIEFSGESPTDFSAPAEDIMAETDLTVELVKECAALDEARKQLAAERERLNAERAQFAEAVAAQQAEKRRTAAEAIVDACVKAGQILPKGRLQLVEFMARLDDTEVVSFGEGDENALSPAAWFSHWLKSLPGIIHYREVSGGADAVKARAKAGATIDPKALAKEARRKMAAEAFGGSLDPRDAVKAALQGDVS